MLTAEQLANQHAWRGQHVAQEQAVLDGFKASLADSGASIDAEVSLGHVAEVSCDAATERQVCQIFIGRSGGSPLAKRSIGSASLTLVQASPAPVTIVP